jgi:hypothetical protein
MLIAAPPLNAASIKLVKACGLARFALKANLVVMASDSAEKSPGKSGCCLLTISDNKPYTVFNAVILSG